jgi:hypothetical protein
MALLGGCAASTPPQILSVKAVPDTIQAGDSCRLVVSTNGTPSDKFKIHWQGKGGKVSSPSDSVATFTASANTGSYKVTVTVTNPASKVASQAVQVQVTGATSLFSGSLGDDEDVGTPHHAGKLHVKAKGGQTPSPRSKSAGGQ